MPEDFLWRATNVLLVAMLFLMQGFVAMLGVEALYRQILSLATTASPEGLALGAAAIGIILVLLTGTGRRPDKTHCRERRSVDKMARDGRLVHVRETRRLEQVE